MKKLILYISVTLDGYIARKDYSIDFLDNFEDPNEDYGYQKFMNGIDEIIMGNNTYKQVLTFGKFPYQDKKCFVLSRQNRGQDEYVTYLNKDFISFVKKLKKGSGGNIWLVGGAEIVNLFLRNNLIDEMRLFIIPILLGAGIRLFANNKNSDQKLEQRLVLKQIKKYKTGVLLTRYF